MEVNRFFFFQAEDGIRDIGVTGVQTCALPILGFIQADILRTPVNSTEIPQTLKDATVAIEDERFWSHNGVDAEGVVRAALRSEERRVGKECRSRWSPYH